jgi:hypothetical protein
VASAKAMLRPLPGLLARLSCPPPGCRREDDAGLTWGRWTPLPSAAAGALQNCFLDLLASTG